MKHRTGDVFHIGETSPGECEMCGREDELRPYGPNGESVCFDCAMKDPAAVQCRLFLELLNGASHVTAPEEAIARTRKQ